MRGRSVSILLFSLIEACYALSGDDLFKVQLAVEKALNTASTNPLGNRCNVGVTGGCCRVQNPNDAGRAEFLAASIRIGFHDAAPFYSNTNTGGSNGCLDFSDGDNNGLSSIANILNAARTTVVNQGVTISIADFWQYAALTSIWCALPNLPNGCSATTQCFPFNYGRIDSTSCPAAADLPGRLPAAEGSLVEIQSLGARWSMSMAQISALMGAHAMGSTKIVDSGYAAPQSNTTTGYNGIGKWVVNNSILDGSKYYSGVLTVPWNRQQDSTNTHHSFVVAPPPNGGTPPITIMLNTDIALAWTIGEPGSGNTCAVIPPRPGGGGGSPPGSCPSIANTESNTAKTITNKFIAGTTTPITNTQQLIAAYASQTASTGSGYFSGTSTVGQDTWFPDFIAAYQVLSELGHGNLLPPTGVTPQAIGTTTTTTTAPTTAAGPASGQQSGNSKMSSSTVGAAIGGSIAVGLVIAGSVMFIMKRQRDAKKRMSSHIPGTQMSSANPSFISPPISASREKVNSSTMDLENRLNNL